MKISFRHLSILVAVLFATNVFAQQETLDTEYGKKIIEATSESDHLNEMIDHLPASDIPTPLDFFGTIVGEPGVLHYTHEIYDYFYMLADASPNVIVRNIGKTEEGRDMLEVVVASEETISNLDTYRGYLNTLSDPRKTNDDEAAEIIKKAKPAYYFTAGLHSPETGSPEMVMELAYRIAVGQSPMIKNIRENAITIITPVTEPDGRDRVVDTYKWREENNGLTPNLAYWGAYVAHDNNRDGYGLALNITRNILNNYLSWTPTVLHDLHESVPFLYVSTGKGPYNPYFDATVVNEWNKLAYNDVDNLTRRDMPGVWTWGYYNGWAGSYLFSIANNRNAIGRFYETFGNSVPESMERNVGAFSATQEWYRMNPPKEKTNWGLRDNVNYSQSGVLTSLDYVATNREDLLSNFYYRSKKAINTGKNEAPHAFVIPKKQNRGLATIRLVNLLRDQGIEVHETDRTVSWKTGKGNTQEIKNGAYIVRMDQPYRTMIGTLLDVQSFPNNYDPPYDDVGWTMSFLYQVASHKVADSDILNQKMNLLTENIRPESKIEKKSRDWLLVNNSTDDEVASFRLQLANIPMQSSNEAFKAEGMDFAAGSFIIDTKNLSGDQKERVENKAKELGINLYGTNKKPDADMHELTVPKIALVHTWIPTPQNAGWWHAAFDKLGIPYSYISIQKLKTMSPDDYDVIILPSFRGGATTLIQGSSMAGPPIPWKTTDLTPNIGKIDETDDMREGMGSEGVANLHAFVNRGGVLITDASSSNIPIELGMTRNVRVTQTRNLVTRGSIFNAEVADKGSPITYGYADTLAVYFDQSPVFQATEAGGGNFFGYRNPEWLTQEQWNTDYPRVVMRFAKNQKDLLLSGMLKGGQELAGKPAVIDMPMGDGNIVMFANHPFWRWQTHGSHSLVFNTILHWDNLNLGKKTYTADN